jgi:hypothetical protein
MLLNPAASVDAPFTRNPVSDHVGNTLLAIQGMADTLLQVHQQL